MTARAPSRPWRSAGALATRATQPVLLLLALARVGGAQSLTMSGNPAKLTIAAATFAGGAPASVSVAGTTYTVGPNVTAGNKITAQLNQAMPTGVVLEAQLGAQAGATSAGWVTLVTTARNVVTNLPTNIGGTAQSISYRLSATSAAGKVVTSSRVVTYTIVAGP